MTSDKTAYFPSRCISVSLMLVLITKAEKKNIRVSSQGCPFRTSDARD